MNGSLRSCCARSKSITLQAIAGVGASAYSNSLLAPRAALWRWGSIRPRKANSISAQWLIAAAAHGKLDELLARQLYQHGPEVVTLALVATGKPRCRLYTLD